MAHLSPDTAHAHYPPRATPTLDTRNAEPEDIAIKDALPTPHLHENAAHETTPARRRRWDPNYVPPEDTDSLNSAHSSEDIPYDGNSPYPEVRHSVHATDDHTVRASTMRSWFLGILFTILLPGVNQFFFFRYPSVYIEGIIAQVLAHPLGCGLARVQARIGRIRGLGWVDEGPWTPKEHTMVYLMANVSCGSAYATNVIATQKFFYGQNWGWGYQILLSLTTQLLGFSFAGPLQRILVTPASMVWPASLVNTSLFNTLHPVSGAEGAKKARTRQRFFYLNAIGMFAWSWFPCYIFTALSMFDWVTWIRPSSQVINLLFGYSSGAGMSLLTFDWGMMASFNNPLAMPWWSTANILGGFVFFSWFLSPILYYSNVFYAKYMPFMTSTIYDRTGHRYQLERVLGEDGRFNATGYEEYSPVYLSISSAMSYGLNFAAITATAVHTVLFFRHEIMKHVRVTAMRLTHAFRLAVARVRPAAADVRVTHPHLVTGFGYTDRDFDIHAKIVASYPAVPAWWYLALFVVTLALSIVTVRVWPTELPVWALLLSLVIAIIMVVPVGMIQAMTNHQVSLGAITQLIIGYILPGRPVAMMVFKTYGYMSNTQALGLISDQKTAQYMHIPPRITFISQLVGAAIGTVTQLLVQEWLFNNVKGICQVDQKYWWCPGTRTGFSSSILWGVLGPGRLFSPTHHTHLYSKLLIFFPIGAIMPVITYLLSRRYPFSSWKFVCWPIIFSCMSLVPPYLPINVISFCAIGLIFQYLIRRRWYAWWSRYNFILSAAWTCGYALCVIVIFFTLQLPRDGEIGQVLANWWGNTVYTNTLDGQGGTASAAYQLGEGGTFGLPEGTWR